LGFGSNRLRLLQAVLPLELLDHVCGDVTDDVQCAAKKPFTRAVGVVRVLADQLGRQYFRFFDKDSFLTGQLPGGAIYRMGSGYREPPGAVSWLVRVLSYGAYAALLVGAVFGLALLGMRSRPWIGIVWSFLAYNLLLVLFLHVKTRYRVQLLPFAFFLSAYTLSNLTALPGAARVSNRALGSAAAGALVLLFLAFS
jgi:hypothetical protein